MSIDWTPIVIAVLGLVGAPGTIASLYWWARRQGKADAVAESADKALALEKEKSDALDLENKTLWRQNDQMWTFLGDVIDMVSETRELIREERQERQERQKRGGIR